MLNQYDVPKKVGFLDCWVCELHIICAICNYLKLKDYNKGKQGIEGTLPNKLYMSNNTIDT